MSSSISKHDDADFNHPRREVVETVLLVLTPTLITSLTILRLKLLSTCIPSIEDAPRKDGEDGPLPLHDVEDLQIVHEEGLDVVL